MTQSIRRFLFRPRLKKILSMIFYLHHIVFFLEIENKSHIKRLLATSSNAYVLLKVGRYLFTENNTAEDTIAAKSAMETQTMETQASPGKTTEDWRLRRRC